MTKIRVYIDERDVEALQELLADVPTNLRVPVQAALKAGVRHKWESEKSAAHGPQKKLGKYLVTRMDGTVPDWPWFVLGANDPGAYRTLLHYREDAAQYGCPHGYLAVIHSLIDEFDRWRGKHGMKGTPWEDSPEDVAQDPVMVGLATGQITWEEYLTGILGAGVESLQHIFESAAVPVGVEARDGSVIAEGSLEPTGLLKKRGKK